jgi:hypothetical protein
MNKFWMFGKLQNYIALLGIFSCSLLSDFVRRRSTTQRMIFLQPLGANTDIAYVVNT